MTAREAAIFRELARAVFATQNALLRHGDMVNSPFGQTSARWRVMLHISQGNGSVAGIARATGYSRQAVQRLADALVADDLAAYAPDQADRRKQVVSLNDTGQATFAAMEGSFDSWSKRLVGALSIETLTDTIALLDAIKQVVEQDYEQIKARRKTNDRG